MPANVELVLVEDNPNDADLTIRALRKNSLRGEVKWLKDGQEALDYMLTGWEDSEEEPPKVMLLDLKLPKIDGLEVLEKIKKDERAKKIPVVVLTSSKQEKDIETAYRNGANSYIVKPVEFDEFVNAVKDLGNYWLDLNETGYSIS